MNFFCCRSAIHGYLAKAKKKARRDTGSLWRLDRALYVLRLTVSTFELNGLNGRHTQRTRSSICLYISIYSFVQCADFLQQVGLVIQANQFSISFSFNSFAHGLFFCTVRYPHQSVEGDKGRSENDIGFFLRICVLWLVRVCSFVMENLLFKIEAEMSIAHLLTTSSSENISAICRLHRRACFQRVMLKGILMVQNEEKYLVLEEWENLCLLVAALRGSLHGKDDIFFSGNRYLTSIFPIGAMFATTLWLGNTAYLYISVAFAQMLKAIMPVAVFMLGVAVGLESMSCKLLSIMLVITAGVLVASYGELTMSWIGVVYQMGGVIGEASRLIFMEIFLKKKALRLNPLSIMYYVSPCSALCLFIPWIFLEKPKMDAAGSWNFPLVILVLNALCTFALNISVFLVISYTSALTIRVAGVVKDWVVVLISALLFTDTKLTMINLFGYCIAIAGVAAYNNCKLRKEASLVTDGPQENEREGPV